jgi:hypothetical protein
VVYPFLGAEVDFVIGHGENLPFRSNAFDIVHLRSVIDHFLNPELALREVYKVMKKSGVLIIGVSLEKLDSSVLSKIKKILKNLNVVKAQHDHHSWHPSIENLRILCTSTGKTFSIKCGLVITAIGYEVGEFSGVPVENGRITNIGGKVEHNLYVVGWAKRGPNGVIGTNKSDASDVVDLLISELKDPKESNGISDLLKSGHEVIDQIAWEKINASEVISGEIAGKPRVKEVDWKQLISLGRS